MFIPNFLLKKEKDKELTEITNEAITQHQNICKQYYTYHKSFAKLNPYELENNVIEWLFSHDLVNLSCLLSLDNNFTSKFIFYLFKKVLEDTRTQYIISKDNFQQIKALNPDNKFMPLISYHCSRDQAVNVSEWRKDYMIDEIERIVALDANKLAYSIPTPSSSCLGGSKQFNSCFNQNNSTNSNSAQNTSNNNNNINSINGNIQYSGEDLELLALLFFKNILFFTLSIFNDTVTLNNELISNKEKFKDLFKTFSFGKSFRCIPKCHLFNDKIVNIYNVDLPEWFEYDKKCKVGYILAAIWEQTIMIRYVIYQIKKIEINYNMSNVLISAKLSEFYIKRKNIINYLKINFPKDKVHLLIAKIMLPKLHQLIMKDTSIKEKYNVSNNNIFCKISKSIFNPINIFFDEEYSKLEDKFKELYLNESTETFVDELLLINPTRSVTFDNFISFLIYEQIGDFFSSELISNLFSEESNSVKEKENKKEQQQQLKKKKRKGKKNLEEKENKSNINNENQSNYNQNNIIKPKVPVTESKTKLKQSKAKKIIKEKFVSEYEEENNEYDEIILNNGKNLDLNRKVNHNHNRQSDLSSQSIITNNSSSIKEQIFTENFIPLSKFRNDRTSSDYCFPLTKKENGKIHENCKLEYDDSSNLDSDNNFVLTQNSKKNLIIDIIYGIIKTAVNNSGTKKEKRKIPFLYETKAKQQPKKPKRDSKDSRELKEVPLTKGTQKQLVTSNGNDMKPVQGNQNSINSIYNGNSIYNTNHINYVTSINEVNLQIPNNNSYSNGNGNGITTFSHNINNQNCNNISNNNGNNKHPSLILNKTVLNSSNDNSNINHHNQSNTGNLINIKTNNTPSTIIESNSNSLTPKNTNTVNLKNLTGIQVNSSFVNNNMTKNIISPKNCCTNNSMLNNNSITPNNLNITSCFSPNQRKNSNITNNNNNNNNNIGIPQPFNISNFFSSLTCLPTNMTMNNPNNKFLMNTSPYLLFPSNLSSSNMGFSIVNNFNTSLKNKDFNEQLNKEIDIFIGRINRKLEMVKPVKESLIEHLKILSQENITSDFEFNLYGSFISDTAVETSDIDVRVNFLCLDENLPTHLAELTYFLKQSNLFKNFQHITTASIPVIKIEINLNDLMSDYVNQVLNFQGQKPKYHFSLFEEEIIKKIYELLKNNQLFNSLSKEKQEEICNIKIDITYTIQNTGNSEKNNHVFKVLDYISTAKTRFGNLRTLLILFKKLIDSHKFSYDSHKLNDSWHGGLSSYCLFLLILACLQYIEFSNYKLTTPAENFIFILNFYSYCFNFSSTVINLNLPNPFNNGQSLETTPTILDPLTLVNASKSCYRILDVQEKLKKIFSLMMGLKEKYEKKKLIVPNNQNFKAPQQTHTSLINNSGVVGSQVTPYDNKSTNSSNLSSNIQINNNISGNIVKQSNSDNASVYSSSENGDSNSEKIQVSEFCILKDVLSMSITSN